MGNHKGRMNRQQPEDEWWLDLPYEACPMCIQEKRRIPLKVFRAGVCRTHYRHLRKREEDHHWDGQPIYRAADFHVWPLKYADYPHQAKWLDMCQKHPWLWMMAPCDHGKTQTVSISYPASKIAENPDIRIALIGATADVAQKRLGAIKAHMQNNIDYIRYFETMHGYPPMPDRPKNWRLDSFTVNRYSGDDQIKDPTVIAIGKGGELEDRRIDLIIPDDMITLAAAMSQVQREADKKWFLNVVMTRGEEDCEVKGVGTPEHIDDLNEWIATGETETGEKVSEFFHVERVRAVAPKGESHYYTDTDNIVNETDLPPEELKCLCPELMSLKGLLKRSRLSHSAFMEKYQCRHSDASDRTFQPSRLMACKNPDLRIPQNYDDYDRDFRMTLMAIDIATGVGVSFFGMTLLGIDMSYKHVVLNLFRKRIRFAQQLEWIMKWYRRYVPSFVFVESNGQQKAIIDAYQSARVIEGVDITGIERVAFEPVFTNKEMILSSVTSVSALVDNGGIEFPDFDKESKQAVQALIKEMKSYPSSALKDLLMSLLIGEAGYAMKFGKNETVGSIPGVPTIKGAFKRRVRGGHATRFKPRRDVKQPAPVDRFGLPKGGGVKVSLVEEIRRHSF